MSESAWRKTETAMAPAIFILAIGSEKVYNHRKESAHSRAAEGRILTQGVCFYGKTDAGGYYAGLYGPADAQAPG